MSQFTDEEQRLKHEGAPDVLSEALDSGYIPFSIMTGAGQEVYLCMEVIAGDRFVLYYEGSIHEWLNPRRDYSVDRNELATTIEESIVNLRQRLDEADVHYDEEEGAYVFGDGATGCSCCGV